MAKSKNRKNKAKWFIPVRGSYLPNNLKGALTYIPFVGYLAFSFWFTWSLNTSNVVTVYLVFVQWAFAGYVMTMVAKQKS